jgi:plasmid stabilization system protein ParE
VTTCVLSPCARRVLSDIRDYSAEQWSAGQADSHVRLIAEVCERLASGRITGRSADSVRAGFFRHPVRSHVLFYRARRRGGIEIAHPAPAHGYRAPPVAGCVSRRRCRAPSSGIAATIRPSICLRRNRRSAARSLVPLRRIRRQPVAACCQHGRGPPIIAAIARERSTRPPAAPPDRSPRPPAAPARP